MSERVEKRLGLSGFQHVSRQLGLSFSETPKSRFLVDDLSFDQISHRPGKLQIFFVLFYEIIKKKRKNTSCFKFMFSSIFEGFNFFIITLF